MNESNRRISSLNRIDEFNQQVASQNDQLIASWATKTVPREPKTPSRQLKSFPRLSKEGPRAPQSGPRPTQDGPRTPQEPSWDGLGAILGPINNKIENQTVEAKSPQTFWVDFGSPNGSQNDPKTTPKRVKNQDEKCITFDRSWTRLGPVLRPSWAHLGVKKVALALRFSMFFEHRHFRTNDGSRRIFDPT